MTDLRKEWTAGRWLALAALALAGLAVNSDIWHEIFVKAWRDEEASHILLVPLVAAWLIWARRLRWRYCRPSCSPMGPVLIALGWAASAFGASAGILSFWHGGAVLVLVGCVLTIGGEDLLLKFFPAFVVLIFLIPVPGRIRHMIAIPLQNVTADVAATTFGFFGVPIERHGNVLTLNGVDVAIAEACNGMRMVFSLFLVTYLFAFSLPLRQSIRVAVLIASPLVAIIANVIRLLPTVWVYGNWSPQSASLFHDVAGWVMLPVAFLVLLALIRALRWAMVPMTRFNLAYA